MKPHGRVVWSEFNTHDPETAKAFFNTTIGWTPQAMPMPEGGTYWLLMTGDEPAGGLFVMDGPAFANVPEHWLTYIEMDDIDRRVAAVVPAGGLVIRPPWTVAGVGRLAIVRAPGGGTMGWMTSARQAESAA